MVRLTNRLDMIIAVDWDVKEQQRQTFSCFNFTNRNDPKFSDRHVWANNVDQDQTANNKSLHCTLFCLHLLGALHYSKATLFKF